MNVKTKKDILVFQPVIAKRLLQLGYRITDIAEDRRVKKKTVFYFANEGNIEKDFEALQKDPYKKP